MVKSKNLKELNYPDRGNWVRWLTYQHWTLEELINGDWIEYQTIL